MAQSRLTEMFAYLSAFGGKTDNSQRSGRRRGLFHRILPHRLERCASAVRERIHGVPTGAAAAFMMRPTTILSAMTS